MLHRGVVKIRKIFVVVMALFVLLSAGGCVFTPDSDRADLIRVVKKLFDGNRESVVSEGVPNDGLVSGNGLDGVVKGEFIFIALPTDLIEHFEVFEYVHRRTEVRKELDYENKYRYFGVETVEGERAHKIGIYVNQHHNIIDQGRKNIFEHTYYFWLNEQEEFLRIVRDGTLVTDERELAVTVSSHYISLTQPYVLTSYWLMPLVNLANREYQGWQLVSQSTATRDFGAGAVDVDIYDFVTSEGDRRYFEITKINGENFFSAYKITGEADIDFRITKLIPR